MKKRRVQQRAVYPSSLPFIHTLNNTATVVEASLLALDGGQSRQVYSSLAAAARTLQLRHALLTLHASHTILAQVDLLQPRTVYDSIAPSSHTRNDGVTEQLKALLSERHALQRRQRNKRQVRLGEAVRSDHQLLQRRHVSQRQRAKRREAAAADLDQVQLFAVLHHERRVLFFGGEAVISNHHSLQLLQRVDLDDRGIGEAPVFDGQRLQLREGKEAQMLLLQIALHHLNGGNRQRQRVEVLVRFHLARGPQERLQRTESLEQADVHQNGFLLQLLEWVGKRQLLEVWDVLQLQSLNTAEAPKGPGEALQTLQT